MGKRQLWNYYTFLKDLKLDYTIAISYMVSCCLIFMKLYTYLPTEFTIVLLCTCVIVSEVVKCLDVCIATITPEDGRVVDETWLHWAWILL